MDGVRGSENHQGPHAAAFANEFRRTCCTSCKRKPCSFGINLNTVDSTLGGGAKLFLLATEDVL